MLFTPMTNKQQNGITIKRGIPIPPKHQPKPPEESPSEVIRLFAKMEVGDCIDIPIPDEKSKMATRANLYPRAKRAGIGITYRFMNEKGKDFIRVWRTDKWSRTKKK